MEESVKQDLIDLSPNANYITKAHPYSIILATKNNIEAKNIRGWIDKNIAFLRSDSRLQKDWICSSKP